MSGLRRFAALFVAIFAGLVALVALVAGAAASNAQPAYTHHPHISCNPHANEHSHVFCDGDGYLPNDLIAVTLHTTTYSLGSVHANSAGAFTNFRVLLPAGVVGTHTITGTGRGGVPSDTASTQIEIVAPGGSGTGGAGAGSGGSGSGGLSSTGVAVIGLGVVGLGLVGVGSMLLISGRRRRQAIA